MTGGRRKFRGARRRRARSMYIPKHFEQTDERAFWDFIDEHAFGTLLTVVDGRPTRAICRSCRTATRACCTATSRARIRSGSTSRARRRCSRSSRGRTATSRRPGTPSAAACRPGTTRSCTRTVRPPSSTIPSTRASTSRRSRRYERGREAPWAPDYDVRRLAGIVGIDIRVARLEGKFKLSQNRSAADRDGVVAQLPAAGATRTPRSRAS